MDLHVTEYEGKVAFLFIDADERIVEFATEFMRSLCKSARKFPKGTLVVYAQKLRDLCVYLENHPVYGRLSIDDALKLLKRPAVEAFYLALQTQGLGEHTVRLAESTVRRFTSWMNSDEANYAHARPIYPDGAAHLTPKPTRRNPKYLKHDQVVTLILCLRFEAQRLALHFLYETGIRISELPRVLKLDLPDWTQYPANQMYFPLLIRGSKGRGGQIKQRYTIISRPMLYRLSKYHNTPGYQFNFKFPESEKPALLNTLGEPWTEDSIEAFVQKAKHRSGLIRASSHMLRHGMSYAILTSEHGKTMLDNLIILQRLLGHTKLETTEGYTDIPAPVLQNIADANNNKDFRYRFEATQDIFDKTYLSSKRQPIARRIGQRTQ